jgi:hypothetical protein
MKYTLMIMFAVLFAAGCSGERNNVTENNDSFKITDSLRGNKGDVKYLNFESAVLSVELSEWTAWTITNLKFKGVPIVGETGANGSVLNAKPQPGEPNDPWIGTGHGKEKISSYQILIDGKINWLIKDSKFKGFTGISGNSCKNIVLKKESNMGPFNHQMEITFNSESGTVTEKNSYTIIEDLEKRFKFLYAYMHCFHNDLNKWLMNDGKKEVEGACDKDDNTFGLNSNIKSIAFYAEKSKTGVAYIYPEVYEGDSHPTTAFRNSIWDRNKDNKLYFQPLIKGKYKKGDSLSFSLTLQPFNADADSWKKQAHEIFAKYNK